MRKILRNMYKAQVPRKLRSKTVVLGDGTIVWGTWRNWRKTCGFSL